MPQRAVVTEGTKKRGTKARGHEGTKWKAKHGGGPMRVILDDEDDEDEVDPDSRLPRSWLDCG